MALDAPRLNAPLRQGDFFDASKPNARRAFSLLAIGACGGLLIAGFGLFTAKGTAVRTIPPEDVALVNQRPILAADFVAQVEAVTGKSFAQATLAEKRKALGDMIREELFVQRGLEIDMPETDPDTRAALVAAVEQQVAADVATENPTDAQLQTYYQAHRASFSSDGAMTVLDLVHPISATDRVAAALADVQQAAKALDEGQTPASAGAHYGLHESGKTAGEEFYFGARIHLGDALFNVARGLREGQNSGPLPQADGVHLLLMISNRVPVPRSFADAREEVLAAYKKDAEARLEASDENFLRGKADILIDRQYR